MSTILDLKLREKLQIMEEFLSAKYLGMPIMATRSSCKQFVSNFSMWWIRCCLYSGMV